MQNLRETKKMHTRHAIITAALNLFQKYGYKETTLAAIADAAGISPRTIFAYFPSKESILFFEADQIIENLSDALTNRKNKSVVEIIREFAEHMNSSDDETYEVAKQRHCMIQENDDLRTHAAEIGDRLEAVFLTAFANELGVAETTLAPVLAAAVMRSALEYIKNSDHGPLDSEQVQQLIAETLTFTEAGLHSLSGQH